MASADFTIADVLAWARTKPADEVYCYINAGGCAVAQFGAETNRPELVGVGLILSLGKRWLYDAVSPPDGMDHDTFGALVARLEALLPDKPISDTWVKADAYMADELVVQS
jgi:hypothetical protein